jgi:hypothetical protein
MKRWKKRNSSFLAISSFFFDHLLFVYFLWDYLNSAKAICLLSPCPEKRTCHEDLHSAYSRGSWRLWCVMYLRWKSVAVFIAFLLNLSSALAIVDTYRFKSTGSCYSCHFCNVLGIFSSFSFFFWCGCRYGWVYTSHDRRTNPILKVASYF